jgi:hypothetical protein
MSQAGARQRQPSNQERSHEVKRLQFETEVISKEPQLKGEFLPWFCMFFNELFETRKLKAEYGQGLVRQGVEMGI